jgi:hypothetical protein
LSRAAHLAASSSRESLVFINNKSSLTVCVAVLYVEWPALPTKWVRVANSTRVAPPLSVPLGLALFLVPLL